MLRSDEMKKGALTAILCLVIFMTFLAAYPKPVAADTTELTSLVGIANGEWECTNENVTSALSGSTHTDKEGNLTFTEPFFINFESIMMLQQEFIVNNRKAD